MTILTNPTSVSFMLKVKEAIKGYQPLLSYCQAKYGKDPNIYVGINDEDPPKATDYPIIVLFAVERVNRGEDERAVFHDLAIGIAIEQESITAEGPNIVIMDGITEVEDVRALVEDAIFNARIGKVSVNGDTLTEYFYPEFRSSTTITLESLRSSRKPLA